MDVETANADFGSICAIGLVHFRSAEVFKSLMILVDPEDDFDPVNIGIHGIRPGDVVGNASRRVSAEILGIVSHYNANIRAFQLSREQRCHRKVGRATHPRRTAQARV
jgi:DNA polymerase III epsilon subunit-like protein